MILQPSHDTNVADHATPDSFVCDKIRARESRLREDVEGSQQRADDQQLLNEMRCNKAVLNLNRALFDYVREKRV